MDGSMDDISEEGEGGAEDELTVLDAVVEVSFGYADDDDDEISRTLCWVDSFTPGTSVKQVADVRLSDGLFHVSMDRMAVSVPMEHLLRLLGKAGVLDSSFLGRSL